MEELEQRITQCHTKGVEDVEDYERASRALGAVGTGANKTKKGSNTPAGKDSKQNTANTQDTTWEQTSLNFLKGDKSLEINKMIKQATSV